MLSRHIAEVVAVYLAVVPSFDGGMGNVEDAGVFEDGVVGFLGEIEHTLGMEFPGQVEAVHIAFDAARGDVAPGVVGLQVGEPGKVEDHFTCCKCAPKSAISGIFRNLRSSEPAS